ncbi:MAG TPA: POTRA domain-containing protein, partial [Blastocatellia bacterium]|nr:POTRA domain-containing protein [Blastocatellia bacterium]
MVVALIILMSLSPPDYGRAIVSAAILHSQQYRIGRIVITGNQRVRELVIRRMIPLEEGDIFNQTLWEQGLEQINHSGLFEPVSPADAVLTLDERKVIVDIELRLKERDHQRIDVNAGGGSTGGISVGVDYANINLSGRADRFFARLRIGNRERSFASGYSIQPLTRLPFVFESAGYYQRLELVDARIIEGDRQPLFVERTGGASLGLSFPLSRTAYPFTATTTARIVYAFSYTSLLDSLAATAEGLSEMGQDEIRIASLTPMIDHNTLDRGFDPRSGQQLITAIEASARIFGGNINTVMPYLDYRRFFAPGWAETEASTAIASREPRVIGFRFRASHISAFGDRF